MKTYLVTGGAGFIGSHIVEALVKKGQRVKVLDNFVTGKKENVQEYLSRIELSEGDVRDEVLLAKVLKGVDCVLHQAALRSVPKSVKDPLTYHEVNATATLKLLMAAKEAGVKSVVYASSSSVYGDSLVFPLKESFACLPLSPYAASKLAGENYCRLFSLLYGLPTVSLRYFNVFGPRQSLESEYAIVVPKFITCLLRGEPPPIHGDGTQSRDFTYIDNVVQANLLAAEQSSSQGEVFNVASGRDYRVLELVDILNQLMSLSIKPVFIEKRPGDVQRTLADISGIKKKLGFKVEVDFKEGLRRTIEWFRKNPPS